MIENARVSTKPWFVGVQTRRSGLLPRSRSRSRSSAFGPGQVLLGACVLSLQFLSAVAHAQPSTLAPEVGYNYGDVETARIAATAQSQRALSNSVSALYSNPANLVSTRIYHFAGLLELYRPEAQRRTLGVAAVDSVTNPSLGAGFGINWSEQDPEGLQRDYLDGRLALAAPVSDALSLGIAGRYLKLTQVGLGPLGESVASSGLGGEAIVSDIGVDAGATVRLSPEFVASVVGMNLNDPGNGFMPTTGAVALGLLIDTIGVGADLTADFTTWQKTTLRPALGAEALLGGNYPVRAGYRYDEGAESHSLSLGAGYIDTSFGVELAARRTVTGPTSTSFAATFSYFLESTGLSSSPTDTF